MPAYMENEMNNSPSTAVGGLSSYTIPDDMLYDPNSVSNGYSIPQDMQYTPIPYKVPNARSFSGGRTGELKEPSMYGHLMNAHAGMYNTEGQHADWWERHYSSQARDNERMANMLLEQGRGEEAKEYIRRMAELDKQAVKERQTMWEKFDAADSKYYGDMKPREGEYSGLMTTLDEIAANVPFSVENELLGKITGAIGYGLGMPFGAPDLGMKIGSTIGGAYGGYKEGMVHEGTDVYNNLRQKGYTHEEADAIATKHGLQEMVGLAVSNTLQSILMDKMLFGKGIFGNGIGGKALSIGADALWQSLEEIGQNAHKSYSTGDPFDLDEALHEGKIAGLSSLLTGGLLTGTKAVVDSAPVQKALNSAPVQNAVNSVQTAAVNAVRPYAERFVRQSVPTNNGLDMIMNAQGTQDIINGAHAEANAMNSAVNEFGSILGDYSATPQSAPTLPAQDAQRSMEAEMGTFGRGFVPADKYSEWGEKDDVMRQFNEDIDDLDEAGYKVPYDLLKQRNNRLKELENGTAQPQKRTAKTAQQTAQGQQTSQETPNNGVSGALEQIGQPAETAQTAETTQTAQPKDDIRKRNEAQYAEWGEKDAVIRELNDKIAELESAGQKVPYELTRQRSNRLRELKQGIAHPQQTTAAPAQQTTAEQTETEQPTAAQETMQEAVQTPEPQSRRDAEREAEYGEQDLDLRIETAESGREVSEKLVKMDGLNIASLDEYLNGTKDGAKQSGRKYSREQSEAIRKKWKQILRGGNRGLPLDVFADTLYREGLIPDNYPQTAIDFLENGHFVTKKELNELYKERKALDAAREERNAQKKERLDRKRGQMSESLKDNYRHEPKRGMPEELTANRNATDAEAEANFDDAMNFFSDMAKQDKQTEEAKPTQQEARPTEQEVKETVQEEKLTERETAKAEAETTAETAEKKAETQITPSKDSGITFDKKTGKPKFTPRVEWSDEQIDEFAKGYLKYLDDKGIEYRNLTVKEVADMLRATDILRDQTIDEIQTEWDFTVETLMNYDDDLTVLERNIMTTANYALEYKQTLMPDTGDAVTIDADGNIIADTNQPMNLAAEREMMEAQSEKLKQDGIEKYGEEQYEKIMSDDDYATNVFKVNHITSELNDLAKRFEQKNKDQEADAKKRGIALSSDTQEGVNHSQSLAMRRRIEGVIKAINRITDFIKNGRISEARTSLDTLREMRKTHPAILRNDHISYLNETIDDAVSSLKEQIKKWSSVTTRTTDITARGADTDPNLNKKRKGGLSLDAFRRSAEKAEEDGTVKSVAARQESARAQAADDADTEARMQEAFKGVKDEAGWKKTWEGIKKAIGNFHSEFPELSRDKTLYRAMESLRRRNSQSNSAIAFAVDSLKKSLGMLKTPEQYQLFTRKRVFDDLAEQLKTNPDALLPFGLTPETLASEREKITKLTESDKTVDKAIETEEAEIKRINDEMIELAEKAGLKGMDKILSREHYFHHEVIAYAQAAMLGETRQDGGKGMSMPTNRGYQKKRHGSAMDINLNYAQAMGTVRALMLRDIETLRALAEIKADYDRSAEFADGKKAIPDGYTEYNPYSGNLIFSLGTVADHISEATAEEMAKQYGTSAEDIQRVVSGRQETWIIPQGIADALNRIGKANTPKEIKRVAKMITNEWKNWTLNNPIHAPAYNLRNITGDSAAAFAGNIRTFLYAPRAIGELRDVYFGGKKASGELAEFQKRGGAALGNNASLLYDPAGSKAFKNLDARTKGERAAEIAKHPLRSFMDAAKFISDFREQILRYATYLSYLDQMKKSKDGKTPDNWGASKREEVLAVDDARDRAFKMSNELIGAYDQVSVSGQEIRDSMMPFYAWLEVNSKRFGRLLANNPANVVGKFGAAYAMMYLFNNFFHKDEEEELPEDVRWRPHINLGKWGGKVRYFDRIGMMTDLFEWVGLDDITSVKQVWNGQLSVEDFLKDMALAVPKKMVDAMGPGLKTAVELRTNTDTYTGGRINQIDDHIMNTFGLRKIYRAMMGKRGEDITLTDGFFNMFSSSAEGNRVAYSHIKQKVREFQERVLKRGSGGFSGEGSPKSEAWRDMISAAEYGQKKKYNEARKRYIRAGGDLKSIKEAKKRLDPLSGLSKEDRVKFLRWLTPEERKLLDEKSGRAMKHYYKVTARIN